MHIFFSVGEPSGDVHASKLIHELRSRHPEMQITGFGGPRMQQADCDLLYPLTQLAVVGFLQVVPKLWEFIQLVWKAEEHLRRTRPDAVVLVDFPGFNAWIARKAHALGIPVFYYLPPQLWGWAPWRIRRIRKFVDHVLSGLDFEVQWYRRRGVEATFVGHPFFDEVAQSGLDAEFITARQTDRHQTVAILPGSRNQEITFNWPIQIRTMQVLLKKLPNLRFLVACYNERHLRMCRQQLDATSVSLPIELHVDRTAEIIELADACLMVSGSVSLELLARTTPGVVLYGVNWSAYLASRILRTSKYITLVNLIAGRQIMPEFIVPGDPTRAVDQMAHTLHGWLSNREILQQKVTQLRDLREKTAMTGATRRTADEILDRLLAAQSDKGQGTKAA